MFAEDYELPESAEYKKVDFSFNLSGVPDKIGLAFLSGQNPGSSLIIDDIEISILTSINSFDNKAYDLIAQPNPAMDYTTIMFDAKNSDDLSFQITDLNGRVIREELIRKPFIGSHEILLDVSEYENGAYIYRITDGFNISTGKLVVAQ